MKKISVLLLFVLFTNVQAQGFNILDYVGAWEGLWTNTTFGSQGATSLEITADTTNKTVQLILDMDGNVLGGADPDPMTINGTYTDTELNVTSTNNTFGDMTLAIDELGNITGNAENVPNANIDRVDFTGTATTELITLNYTVTFSASAGGGTAVGVLTLNNTNVGIDDSDTNPTTFTLHQNHPNPFNPSTMITFDLSQDSDIKISIYDMTGRLVRELTDQTMTIGSKNISWDGKDDIGNSVSGGVYLYNLQTGDRSQTKKMVLMK